MSSDSIPLPLSRLNAGPYFEFILSLFKRFSSRTVCLLFLKVRNRNNLLLERVAYSSAWFLSLQAVARSLPLFQLHIQLPRLCDS